jgi:hypothetical protein
MKEPKEQTAWANVIAGLEARIAELEAESKELKESVPTKEEARRLICDSMGESGECCGCILFKPNWSNCPNYEGADDIGNIRKSGLAKLQKIAGGEK